VHVEAMFPACKDGAWTVVPAAVAQGDVAGGPDLGEPCEDSDKLLCADPRQIEPWDLSAADPSLDIETSSQLASADLQSSYDLLECLIRDWQSTWFGHIELRASTATDTIDVLHSGSRKNALQPIGTVCCAADIPPNVPNISHIRLQVFNGTESTFLWLMPRESRRHRVFWKNIEEDTTDIWDSTLLDAIRKAALWLLQNHLQPYLEPGFAGLDEAIETTSDVSVALCIATMNRLWQLRRALPVNLLHCWPHRSWVRIHIVDFGSTDGTLEWLLRRCQAAIDCGLLVVYSSDQLPFWHASVGKNTAHMVAREDILVNLDSDNLVGPGFPCDVLRQFDENGCTALQYEDGEGTCGRIACWRSDFHKLRGYDEDCFPMGAQDVDLVLRLKALPNAQFRKVRIHTFSQAIHNSIELKVCMCNPAYGQLKWGRMDVLNRTIFKERRDAGLQVRNLHKSNIGVKAWQARGNLPGIDLND